MRANPLIPLKHAVACFINSLDPVPPRCALGVLRRARRLVWAGWTQSGSFCTDWKDRHIDRGNMRSATRFCMRGAVERAATYLPARIKAVTYLMAATPAQLGIVSFNDSSKTSKKDVLEAFDKAIGAAS